MQHHDSEFLVYVERGIIAHDSSEHDALSARKARGSKQATVSHLAGHQFADERFLLRSSRSSAVSL